MWCSHRTDGQLVGDCGGLDWVTHTTDLKPLEARLVQHLLGKPLFKKHKYEFKDTVGLYRTIDLPLWQDAYSCLDWLRFLKGDFCTPLGVYVASLLHWVDHCLGSLGLCAPVGIHVADDV